MNRGINPQKNFLLKKAERLAKVERDQRLLSLFRLSDGRLLVLSKSKNPLVNDQLTRIDVCAAREWFKVSGLV